MSYAYTNGDGVAALDPATPNGAAEPVSNLDDAVKQIKAWIRDTTSNVGGTGMISAITALQAAVTGIPASVTGQGAFSVSLGTQQDIVFGGSGSMDGTVSLDTEAFDPDSAFNSTLYEFSAPYAGYYFISASVSTTKSGGSPTEIDHESVVYLNGAATNIILNHVDGTEMINGAVCTASGLLSLAAGDKVTLHYAFTANGAVTVEIQPNGTRLAGYRIR